MHWIDLTIMAAYILGCVVAGLLARGKGDDAEDYFTARGRLNNWFSTIVVGLSIAGTFFSGISFISYPSVVYSSGILLPVWGLLICMPVGGWRCGGRAMVVGMLAGWAAGVGVTFSGAAALWVAPVSAAATLAVAMILSHLTVPAVRPMPITAPEERPWATE